MTAATPLLRSGRRKEVLEVDWYEAVMLPAVMDEIGQKKIRGSLTIHLCEGKPTMLELHQRLPVES